MDYVHLFSYHPCFIGNVSFAGDVGGSSSPISTSIEKAAAETLNMSFGAHCYAKKIPESMVWKEVCIPLG